MKPVTAYTTDQAFWRLLIWVIPLEIVTNMAHPFTPKLFTSLHMPDYMFGVSFASMALASFLFAPFWGKTADQKGRARVLSIMSVGYGIGQLLFSWSTTIWVLVPVRFATGFFSCANTVCSMSYVTDITTPDNRTRYMSYLAAAITVSGAVGYLFGGVLGDISIPLAFGVQVVLMLLLGVGIWLFLPESYQAGADPHAAYHPGRILRTANPFRLLSGAGRFLNAAVAVFLLVTFLASFATYAFDQAFNYFIKAELDFPTTYNGIIKAVVGLLGLLINVTVTIWLSRRADPRLSAVGILFLCGVTALATAMITQLSGFLACTVLFYSVNAMHLPVLQALATRCGGEANSNGIMAGMFQSSRNLGMMGGALFAGFIYMLGSRLPFVWTGIAFFLSAGLMLINFFQFRRRERAGL
ncbi:MAG TPA: MFS transporter [Firmicutes bacterium]|nr:MFS transporter [Bacillota bacterium]